MVTEFKTITRNGKAIMITWRHSRCLFHRRLQSWSQSQSPWWVRVLLRTHTHNHRISFWMYNRFYHHRRRRVYLQSVYTFQPAVQPGCTAGWTRRFKYSYTHTRLTALCPGLPGWAGTRKIKTNLDFTEARDSDWQWHQLGNMQVCT